jgi:prolyl oligopeptidase
MRQQFAARLLGVCALAISLQAVAEMPVRPSPAPVRPVTETLWGQSITDDYRYMEELDPTTVKWMKEEGAYSRGMLDAIASRAALETQIARFTASLSLVRGLVRFGGRSFYLERLPGSDHFDLIAEDSKGRRKLIDIAALNAANGGKPHSIDFFFASPDGARVAAGISQGGSESASIFVHDAATGRRLADPIDRADPGFVTWSTDSSRLYFTRLKKLGAADADIEKYRDTTVVAWDLKSEPMSLLGSTVRDTPKFLPDETPALTIYPGAPQALALSYNGVQNELALWLAPVSQLHDPEVKWTPFVQRSDEVTGVAAAGNVLYLLSHKNAPTFQVLDVEAGAALDAARVLVPAQADRVIDSIHAASDALYVLARQGAYSKLLRVPHDTRKPEPVMLPFQGLVGEIFSDPRQLGITIGLESFVRPMVFWSFEPGRQRFVDLALGTPSTRDASRFQIIDLEARSGEVRVPSTLIRAATARGPQIVVIQSYGAYGISQVANFSRRAASFLESGGSYAYCHVRGGGELGEAWRLGGKDANKPNSWRDLIACAEDLIRRGYTTREKLFLFSGSAGGITVGRAITERPELFAGVIAVAAGVNTLRQEFQPNGPLNIPEFGTITTEAGFRNLLEMDTIQHVRRGVAYPPVMLTTGLNDPRVSPWEPAKLAAALRASGSPRPVLLRIDADAGHDSGSTKAQEDALLADMWAFVFWSAGLAQWQPR